MLALRRKSRMLCIYHYSYLDFFTQKIISSYFTFMNVGMFLFYGYCLPCFKCLSNYSIQLLIVKNPPPIKTITLYALDLNYI